MAALSPLRAQARITLPADARAEIDAFRLRWNPEIAAGNPAHVTIAYHDEAADVDLLRARLGETCRRTAPFPLALGEAMRFAAPVRGIYLAVADPTDAIAPLRRALLAPPFRARDRFGLHVTLLHPAVGERTEEAWPALPVAPRATFTVARVDLVAGVGPATRVLDSFALA